MFADNNQYDTKPQVVKFTFQPFTSDGVPIDGAGQPNEGIDFRITFAISPDDPKAATPTYNRTLCDINDRMVGASTINPGFKPLPYATVDYGTATNNPVMKQIVDSFILPHLSQAFYAATTEFQVKDLQESRDALENIIIHGLKRPVKDVEGKELIDPKTNQPVYRQVVRPLEEVMKEANLKLDSAQLSQIDIPDFLASLNSERTKLNIEMTNFDLDIKKAKEEQKTVREQVRAEWAKEIQTQQGTNRGLIAGAEQRRTLATEEAKRKLNDAQVTRNTVIANAEGFKKTEIAKAKQDAVKTLTDAQVEAQAKHAEAIEKSAPILADAQAFNRSLMALGEQFKNNPRLKDVRTAELVSAARQALAAKVDSGLLAPGTDPTKLLSGITVDDILKQLNQGK
jgi:hypothetical protein